MYNNKCVVFDVGKMSLTYYEYGASKLKGHCKCSNDFINWCVAKIPQRTCVVLLGTFNQTVSLFRELERNNFNVCIYELADVENDCKADSKELLEKEIISSLNEIKGLLKREQPKSANYALINTTLPQREAKDYLELKSFITNSLEAVNKKQMEMNYLVTELYNRNQENSCGSEAFDDLRKELSAYKNDFYQKSMMKFGVNIAIEILERLYSEKNLLYQEENAAEFDRITKIISFCENKMKKLNLRVRHSSNGEEFDGERMVTYDDKVSTDDENMKGRIAYSISPAIYWTLPRVNAPGEDELLIKEENVALYE